VFFVQIYSRNSEDNTGKYPDIVAMFPGALAEGVKSVVLDAEAVAFDPVHGKVLPFQVRRDDSVMPSSCGTWLVSGKKLILCRPDLWNIPLAQVLSTRARKDVTLENIKVSVCVFAFDCLYKDGRALLQEPLTARREALYAALKPTPGKLEFATAKVRYKPT